MEETSEETDERQGSSVCTLEIFIGGSQNVLTKPDDEEMHLLSCSMIENFTSTCAEYRLRSHSSAELGMGQAKI